MSTSQFNFGWKHSENKIRKQIALKWRGTTITTTTSTKMNVELRTEQIKKRKKKKKLYTKDKTFKSMTFST